MDSDHFDRALKQELESLGKFFNDSGGLQAAHRYIRGEYVDAKTALHSIGKLLRSDKFDTLISCLALNDFNRFVLRKELNMLQSGVHDIINLSAFLLLSIAWQMRKEPICISQVLEDLLKCMEMMENVWGGKSESTKPSSSDIWMNSECSSTEIILVKSDGTKADHEHAVSPFDIRKPKRARFTSEDTLRNLDVKLPSSEDEDSNILYVCL